MSEQPGQTRACPTCGNTVPSMARYCPNCGTRLNPTTAYTADDFEDALADVLDAPEEAAPDDLPIEPVSTHDQPTTPVSTVSVPSSDPQPEWTASASDWTQPQEQPGTWAAQPPIATTPARSRSNRTLWIILAIVGFIVFCCCGSFAALVAIGSNDTAFQNEVSQFALLWMG
jgi:hypothetical protein